MQIEGVVNEEILIRKIEEGKAKTILDRLVNKKVDTRLRKTFDNVILTPHTGFYTRQVLERLTTICIENAKGFLKGKIQNRVL